MPAAWTLPRTWTAGELVTAAIGNSAWRDNLMYLKDSPTFDGDVTVTGTTLLTGVATLTAAPVFSSATASQAVFTNGSKALVSNAITGTGNVVMSASPTLTGTIAGAAMTLSSTLGVTGATTLSSTVATGALTVTGAATVSTTLGVTGLITSTGGITGGASSHTTGAFSSTVTGGTYNGQTISSAANFTGTLAVTGASTLAAINASGVVTLSSAIATHLSINTTGDTYAPYLQFGGYNRNVFIGVLDTGSDGNFVIAAAANLSSPILTASPATNAVTLAGLLTVSGFGTSSFSAGGTGAQILNVRNTTAGAGNYASVALGNDTASNNLQLMSFSTTYTTSGPYVAGSGVVDVNQAGGLSIAATNASGEIRFYSGGSTLRWSFTTSGVLLPDNTYAIGSTTKLTGVVHMGSATPVYAPNTTTNTGTALVQNANGFWYMTSSSARYKENIAPWQVSDDALRQFVALTPKLWDYTGKQNGAGGFISEDLDALGIKNAYGSSVLVNYNKDGLPESNRDFALIGLQHLVLQQHDATISQLAARIAALETKDN